jgi:Family of unknown function (DUF6294)
MEDTTWTAGPLGERLEAIQFLFPKGIPDGTKLRAIIILQGGGLSFPIDLGNNAVVGEPGQNKPIGGIQIAMASGAQADKEIANSFRVGLMAVPRSTTPPAPTAEPFKRLTWQDDIHVGDCAMHGATITFYPHGTGHFEAQVMTNHTTTSDIWSQTSWVKGPGGVLLFTIDNHEGPKMPSRNKPFPGPSSWYSFYYDFTFPRNLYDQIEKVEGSCGC